MTAKLVSVRKVNSFFLSEYKSHLKFAQRKSCLKLYMVTVSGKCTSLFSAFISAMVTISPVTNEENIRDHTFDIYTQVNQIAGESVKLYHSNLESVSCYKQNFLLSTFMTKQRNCVQELIFCICDGNSL